MKKNDNKRSGVGYYIVITIMVIILCSNIGGLIASTSPEMSGYYSVSSPEELLRKMDFSGYQRMLEYKKINEAMGVTASSNKNYVVPYAISSPFRVWVLINGFAAKRPTRKNTRKFRKVRNRPVFAAASDRSNFLSPRERDSSALMPTPVPDPRAIIRFCRGKAMETAVRASSLNRAT